MNNLLTELKRRNIFRVAGVYAVVGWLIMQVIAVMTPALKLPDWVDSFFAIMIIAGFPIAVLLAWAFELTPEGVKPTKAIATDESITAKTGRKLDYAILVGLVMVVGLLVVQLINPSTKSSPTPETITASQTTEASIAVLPFVDLSPDGDQEYFGDGIAEELLNVFAKIKQMKVAGRTSSFAYKGQNLDLREIGRVLGVATILEGSIRKQGERVRVTAQLIKADDGFHIWSETYDRDLVDIFAVQDDISREISIALMPHLMGNNTPELQNAKRTDVDAYKDFLEARQLVHGRTVAGFNRAKTLLEGVINTDPNYAPAYAVLAQVELNLSDAPGNYGDTPFSQVEPIIVEYLDRALRLDPELSHAYAVRGLLLSKSAKTTGDAITAYERALDINPNNLDAKMWLAFAYIRKRRHQDTAETLIEVFNKDPLYGPIGHNAVNYLLEIMGDVDRAQLIIERLDAIDANNIRNRITKLNMDIYQGRWGEAITTFREYLAEDPDNNNIKETLADTYLNIGATPEVRLYGNPIYVVHSYVMEGEMNIAREKYESLLATSPESPILTNHFINVLAHKGDFQDVVDYYYDTWDDLRDFENKTFNPYRGTPPSYANLALSFQRTGREALAKETLKRMRTSLDIDKIGGANELQDQEAQWQVLTGNHEKAIATLKEAFRKRSILPKTLFMLPAFDSIREHPDFIDLNTRNIARINEERALLGLGPIK